MTDSRKPGRLLSSVRHDQGGAPGVSSLEERYPGGLNDYLNKVRVSASRLVEEKFLLEADAAVIVHSAAESPLFRPTAVLAIFR